MLYIDRVCIGYEKVGSNVFYVHHSFSDDLSVVFRRSSSRSSEIRYLRVGEVVDDGGRLAVVRVGHYRPKQAEE